VHYSFHGKFDTTKHAKGVYDETAKVTNPNGSPRSTCHLRTTWSATTL
jgi:hypothetical protein